MENTMKYKAIVIGATGACGRELVDQLLVSPEYDKITIYVRRKINRWENLSDDKAKKLDIKLVESLDILGEGKEEWEKRVQGEAYNVVFCCLGSRVGRGDEEFKKVDYTYVCQCSELCEKLNIPHFSLVSSGRADKSSWFMFCRVKGEAEEEVMKKNIDYITIMKPGIILGRDNDERFGEGVAGWIPFLQKIESKDVGKALLLDDLHYQKLIKKEKKVAIFNNTMMLDIIQKQH